MKPAERKQRLVTYILAHGHRASIQPFTGYLQARSAGDTEYTTWTNCPTLREVREWLGY